MMDFFDSGEIPPSSDSPDFKGWVYRALAALGIVAVCAAMLLLLANCGGALCRACAANPQLEGCKEAYSSGLCKLDPTPTPEPTAEPTPTPEPTAEPTPTPTPEPLVCSLGTPAYTVAQSPSWGISPYGRGYHFTPKARFGKAYYCSAEMNWPEACAAGRFEGPVAPDGHPQRRPCEYQFMQTTRCPIVNMGKCTGVGNQCPITFDAWIYDPLQNKEVPHQINREADCDEEGMLPQNGETIRAQWAQPSGKGTLKVCFENGWCTESQEFEK